VTMTFPWRPRRRAVSDGTGVTVDVGNSGVMLAASVLLSRDAGASRESRKARVPGGAMLAWQRACGGRALC